MRYPDDVKTVVVTISKTLYAQTLSLGKRKHPLFATVEPVGHKRLIDVYYSQLDLRCSCYFSWLLRIQRCKEYISSLMESRLVHQINDVLWNVLEKFFYRSNVFLAAAPWVSLQLIFAFLPSRLTLRKWGPLVVHSILFYLVYTHST